LRQQRSDIRRELIVAAFLSVDGIMQAPGGPEEDTDGGFTLGGWTFPHWDAMMGEVMDKQIAEPFDLLLGRRTYDIFAAHWPRAGDDPIAVKFNGVIKYVATSRPDTLKWVNSQALKGAPQDAVAKLKDGDGPPLLTQGSAQLLQALIAADLVDEFRLWVFPVALGRGKRLFGGGAIPMGLAHADSKTSSTGVVMTTYRRAGDVTVGSFALDTPA
jgi:dihydrofolate reductase